MKMKFASYLGYVVLAIIFLAFCYCIYWFIAAAIESDWHWTYIENEDSFKQVILTIWLWMLYLYPLKLFIFYKIMHTPKKN